MSQFQVVNPQKHKGLKICTDFGVEFGDNIMATMVCPFEFRNIQTYYPIFFHKSPDTGQFIPVALLGFEKNENLYLEGSRWLVPYVPLSVIRQPFAIAKNKEKTMILVDMDSARVSEDIGESLFLEHGGYSEYFTNSIEILSKLDQGAQHAEKFVNFLQKYDLLEPLTLNITLKDKSSHQLLGYYTLQEDNIKNLTQEQLAQLQESHCLMPLFMILASIPKLHYLIELKNNKLGL